MSPEPASQERFLEPGEIAFGDGSVRIKTMLGSCVAITFWHPGQPFGAMCHYLLPGGSRAKNGQPDARYAEDAIGAIRQKFRWLGLPHEEIQVKMFGGGNMFPDFSGSWGVDIGAINVKAGLRILQQAGFNVLRHDLAGVKPRVVIFEISSGAVWVSPRPAGGGRGPASEAVGKERRSR